MRSLRAGAAFVALISAGCGNGKKSDEVPSPVTTASATASPGPEAPRSPLSIVLESKGEIAFSAVENGIVVVDQARSRMATARAAGSADLVELPMPSGIPSGSGRVLRAGGRLPSSLWLSYEKLRDDGKADGHPLFRLSKDGWKMLADDWKPAITGWSKHRILAASTSSGKLKIKVIEPSLPKPPDDLPSVVLADPTCAKSLQLADITALSTGEVVAVGTCKADVAAGAGASAKRYVVIRWPVTRPSDAGAPAPEPASIDGGAMDGGAVDGATDGAPTGPVGVVDVVPGVSGELSHRALFMRSASDIWAAAMDPSAKPPAARLFHFDGTTWGAEPLPPGALVRGLAGTPDGSIWIVADHAIWKKPLSAAWEQVPLPLEGAWEMVDVRATGEGDVWFAGRVRSAGSAKDVVMRTRPTANVMRWE